MAETHKRCDHRAPIGRIRRPPAIGRKKASEGGGVLWVVVEEEEHGERLWGRDWPTD